MDECGLQYFCCYCNQSFNQKNNMYRHQKRCKERVSESSDSLIAKLTMAQNEIASLKAELEIKNREIELHKIEIDRLSIVRNEQCIQNHGTMGDVNMHNTQNITINVQILDFGKETHQHITPEFLQECLSKMHLGLPNLFEAIHFNPQVPQNMNIRHKSAKQGLVETYTNGHWVPTSKSSALAEAVARNRKIMHKFVTDPRPNLSSMTRELNRSKQEYLENLIDQNGNNEYYKVRKQLAAIVMKHANTDHTQ